MLNAIIFCFKVFCKIITSSESHHKNTEKLAAKGKRLG